MKVLFSASLPGGGSISDIREFAEDMEDDDIHEEFVDWLQEQLDAAWSKCGDSSEWN